MSDIKISIVSSSEEIYSGEATMVFATGSIGELGTAPGHTPLLTGLAAGPVRVQNGSEEETFFCSGGFVEVQPNAVTILSDTAERADSLDESEALKAKEAAEQSLADQQSTIDYTKAAAQLAEAVARLKTIQKLRKNI